MPIRLPQKQHIKVIPELISPKERRLFVLLLIVAIASSIGILKIVDAEYSSPVPARGGTITEGVIGKPRFINPILATSDVDRDLVDLIYSGLMRNDGNGNIVPELAERYELSADGLTYTFYLRKDLSWHDEIPLTADDVVFTINAATNPALASPRRAYWEGVSVVAVDEYTVQFTLRKPYAPFIANTTLGILPEHRWEGVTSEEFPLHDLNIAPIGSGPYRVNTFHKNDDGSITDYLLKSFEEYRPHEPYIGTVKVRFYENDQLLITAYKNNDIDLISAPPEVAAQIDEPASTRLELTVPKIFLVFYNQAKNPALADASAREALELAVSRNELVKTVAGGFGIAKRDPVFSRQPDSVMDASSSAEQVLTDGGWVREEDGIWRKQIKKVSVELKLTLSTANNSELLHAAETVRSQWGALGIPVTVEPFDLADLEQVRIRPREFEALLFGQVVGFQSDPFAFWHSSQRNDPGQNVAMYANPSVDKSLEAIRNNITLEEREEHVEKFIMEFHKDRPALILYSPYQLYYIHKPIRGLSHGSVNLPSERFSTIEKWHLKTRNVWNFLLSDSRIN